MQLLFSAEFQICLFVKEAATVGTNKLLSDRWILMGFRLCNSPTETFSGVRVSCWPEPLVHSPENIAAIQKTTTYNVHLTVFSNSFKT